MAPLLDITMHDSGPKISGCVDTFHKGKGFSGWAACLNTPDMEIDFLLFLNGAQLEVTATRILREDLAHLGSNFFGFEIDTKEGLNYRPLLGGKFEIRARQRGAAGQGHSLALGGLLFEQIARSGWIDQLSSLDDNQLRIALSEALPSIDTISKTVATERVLKAEGALRGTPVLLPVGLQSIDGSIVMGEHGHAFLIGGSNNVLANLQDENARGGCPNGLKWADLFSRRNAICKEKNIKYSQCVIPEKISVMPEISGLAIDTPTPTLRTIEKELSFRSVAYPSILSTLRNAEEPHETFDRIDTHFSASGAFLSFMAILKSANIDLSLHPKFVIRNEPIIGDVSDRFFEAPLLCTSQTVEDVPFPLSQQELKLTEEYDPPNGGHIGVRRVFVNPAAPLPMKVVVFGNSFFERGGAPKTLSWWFARAFQEFHFIWHPDFDWDYIDRIHPDLVVGQTIERFLTRIPTQ